MTLEPIIRKFIPSAGISSIAPHGSGHIHDTYLVKADTLEFDYILQRINSRIFKDIPGIMENVRIVTSCLKEKFKNLPGHDPFRETLNLVPTIEGNTYYRDEQGNFWRVFIFIPGMKMHDNALDPEMAYEAGRIIGLFHRLLTDLKEPLKDTMPGFHSIIRRSAEFRAALKDDPKARRTEIKDDISFVEERLEEMIRYFNSFENQGFPKRIVHYDTKLNNILFDEHNKAVCLIDLDTLCPGYVHFDYGDALRTLANIAREDEQDLSAVKFNLPYYQSFTAGYLGEAGYFLSNEEKDLLNYAPIYLTFVIGLRFLTDYMNGDGYFKINYADHNLVRARVQFRLVEEMERSLGLRA